VYLCLVLVHLAQAGDGGSEELILMINYCYYYYYYSLDIRSEERDTLAHQQLHESREKEHNRHEMSST
jgi:hypothetical protein